MQSNQPLNETAQSVQLQQYSHPIAYRHDFTPDVNALTPVSIIEMFPGRHVSYNVQNSVQLMPLAGDCKQDMYMYTESFFSGWHTVWAKWSLFRYGRLNAWANVDVPASVPYFTLRQILTVSVDLSLQNEGMCPLLMPGSLLDSLYGLCNLLLDDENNWSGGASHQDLSSLAPQVLDRPINGLYLRAWYHHYLINHTNENTNLRRGNMVNDEYPFRDKDMIDDLELSDILIDAASGLDHLPFSPAKMAILHERDYFTTANPEPQKGNAVTVNGGSTVQDLTKAIHRQEILEKDADAGTSHYEAIVARYGVIPHSLKGMKPVQCGETTRQVISINPIFNQAGDTVAPTSGGLSGVNFQGDISGRGFSADGSHHVEFTADVDGCLITLIYIRPETIYHQGLNRMFTRLQRNEFFEPAMITDGDEPIYNYELYHPLMSPNQPRFVPADSEGVFGYRNKYLDFIYKPSRVSGEFHSTMKHWSLHRDFSGSQNPGLNDVFVRGFDAPTRIFSYEGQPSRLSYPRFICYMQFVGQMRDCIPNYTKREI